MAEQALKKTLLEIKQTRNYRNVILKWEYGIMFFNYKWKITWKWSIPKFAKIEQNHFSSLIV